MGSGGGAWVTGDTITAARANQKSFLIDTGANISSATTYAGMPAYCTSTGSGFTADHLYVRNAANSAWNDIGSLIVLTSGQVTTALGYTPENPANKNTANGYPGLNASGVISSAQIPLFYGDGADGAVTISSNTTLSRDMSYSNLTVNSSIVLNTAGNIYRVNGTLANSGTITDTTNIITGAAGGSQGYPGVAGTGKTVGNILKNGFLNGANGSGGGGGGASGATGGNGGNGGNGGTSGGIVVGYVHTINNAGSINANAGNGTAGASGGTPTTGAGGGGGGGGDGGTGGTCKLVYNTTSGSGLGSVTASAGSGGGQGSGGNHGTANQGSNSSGSAGGASGNGTAGGSAGSVGVAGGAGSNGSGGGGGGCSSGTTGTTGGAGGAGVAGASGLLIIDNV